MLPLYLSMGEESFHNYHESCFLVWGTAITPTPEITTTAQPAVSLMTLSVRVETLEAVEAVGVEAGQTWHA